MLECNAPIGSVIERNGGRGGRGLRVHSQFSEDGVLKLKVNESI